MRCKICGAVAKGSHYSVLSCMSCKVFFQRHGLKDNDAHLTLKCRFSNGLCTINERTRKYCICCRLTACLQAGMHPKESKFTDGYRVLIERKYQRAQLVPLDLLNTDRSSLNVNQWTVISNITHIYDTLFDAHKQNLSRFHIDDGQKPIKLRLKISNYQQLVSTYFAFMTAFLEHIPEYRSLELSNRSTLIQHNIITLTGINSHYLASTVGFIPYFDKNYSPIMNMIYGSEIILENEKLRQKLDHIFHADVILVKLVLAVLAFENVTSNLSSTSQQYSKSIDNQWKSSNTLLTIRVTCYFDFDKNK